MAFLAPILAAIGSGAAAAGSGALGALGSAGGALGSALGGAGSALAGLPQSVLAGMGAGGGAGAGGAAAPAAATAADSATGIGLPAAAGGGGGGAPTAISNPLSTGPSFGQYLMQNYGIDTSQGLGNTVGQILQRQIAARVNPILNPQGGGGPNQQLPTVNLPGRAPVSSPLLQYLGGPRYVNPFMQRGIL